MAKVKKVKLIGKVVVAMNRRSLGGGVMWEDPTHWTCRGCQKHGIPRGRKCPKCKKRASER